jgi:hypothetical protein
MNAEIAISTPIPMANTAAMTRLNRMKPLAEGTCALSGQKIWIGRADYNGQRLASNLGRSL